MKYLVLILSFLVVTSCASIQTTIAYDKVANPVSVKYDGKPFNVFDDIDKGAALLMEGAAADITKAFFEGLTLTLVDLTAPVSSFEGAMQTYLDENKETPCEITRSNFISDGLGGGTGYEIFYKCE